VSANGQTVIQLFEQWAPRRFAVPDDRIGLQLGTLNKPVSTVLTALDVTEAVVDEAAALGAELIIAHHALIFRPLKSINTDTAAGRIIEKCLRSHIAIYAAHTNLDTAPGGINDMMADALGLTDRTHLEEIHEDALYKLIVYVPEPNVAAVSEAMFAAGAGSIGDYSCCSFRSRGTGTFLPGEGTNPYIGAAGRLEEVPEVKVETVVPASRLKQAVAAMIKAHPYEEPAYDVFPQQLPGMKYGLGRVGRLPEPVTLKALCERVKQAFDVPMVRAVGNPDRMIEKVAVLGGSGSKYAAHARFAGADVLITGDIDYHTAQDALADGLALIDPGHNAEKIMKRGVADQLTRMLAERKLNVRVVASQIDTEPFRFV
jgi:dinuclear metal center YbgI/SA1388 family protein